MFSQYAQDFLLQSFFSNPVTVALMKNGVEVSVSGTGYARQPFGAVSYTSTSPITASNQDVITFPAPTSLDWGDIDGIALYDALVGGNVLVPVQSIPIYPITVGTPFVIGASALRLRI